MISPTAQHAYIPQTNAPVTAKSSSTTSGSATQHSQQDVVHLSAQALAASGDCDHDGDSH